MSKYKEQKKKQVYKEIFEQIEFYKDEHPADYDWYLRQSFEDIILQYEGSRVIIDDDVIRMMISAFPNNRFKSIDMLLGYYSAHFYLNKDLIRQFNEYFKNNNFLTYYSNDTMIYTQKNLQLLKKMNIINI